MQHECEESEGLGTDSRIDQIRGGTWELCLYPESWGDCDVLCVPIAYCPFCGVELEVPA